MTPSTPQFLIVDDDKLNNFLTRMAIKKSFEEAEIIEFIASEEALTYMEKEFTKNPDTKKATLFLDINMPTVTAWEFLEKFDTFAEAIKMQFDIYILSSSIDLMDIQRAKNHPLVLDFIEKPLNKTILAKLFS